MTRAYPAGEVPTKIKGWRGNWKILTTLAKACLSRYDPHNAAGTAAIQKAEEAA